MLSTKVIAYVRVSTQKQGKSGLGLEAQRAAIDHFAGSEGLEIIRAKSGPSILRRGLHEK